MALTLERAKKIATGYMSPRNEAINVFSQQGKVEPGLVAELERELALKRKFTYRPDWAAEFERLLHAEELEHLITWLAYSGAARSCSSQYLIDGEKKQDPFRSAWKSRRNTMREILRNELKDSPSTIVEDFILTGELSTDKTQELVGIVRDAASNLYSRMRQAGDRSSSPDGTPKDEDEFVLLNSRYRTLLAVVEWLS